ncbi:hypothetical protein OBBRIDRAFT_838066 [Obba rivulosa]|uniref:Uncharacterized protein n=1 Tax=Obba rivulosa TaxID=1052685 RepID=A0A8E2AR33_9APHY|nr:hypothetical protein OBBRIDRAFT_838066 [Obba rivulosa]
MVHFCKPRIFSGKASEVDPFIKDVRNAIHLQCLGLTTDYDKYTSVELAKPDLLYNFEGFISYFKNHFEDSNLAATYLHKLHAF